jgi:hypothetical protein
MPPSGSTFGPGTTPVTCMATNVCLTNTCSFNVTVIRTAALSILCPADVSTNICGANVVVDYVGLTVTGGTLTGCTPSTGSTFGPGTTPVTCTATNLCGTNNCSFNVTVTQVPALSIVCPAHVRTNVCGANVPVSYTAPTVTGGTLTGCAPASGSSFAPGVTVVTCTATNPCTTNTCSFNVTVTQVATLALTCPANVSTNICGANPQVSYDAPTVTGGTLTGCAPASGSTFGPGVTAVICTATNVCLTNTARLMTGCSCRAVDPPSGERHYEYRGANVAVSCPPQPPAAR